MPKKRIQNIQALPTNKPPRLPPLSLPIALSTFIFIASESSTAGAAPQSSPVKHAQTYINDLQSSFQHGVELANKANDKRMRYLAKRTSEEETEVDAQTESNADEYFQELTRYYEFWSPRVSNRLKNITRAETADPHWYAMQLTPVSLLVPEKDGLDAKRRKKLDLLEPKFP